jgi:hypothetical protein
VIGRAIGHPGVGTLRAIIGGHAITTTLTRRELEERFLALCRSADVPAPTVNAWLTLDTSGVETGFLWRAQRLVVETDGRARTVRVRPSSATDGATSASCSPAGASYASPGARSSTSPSSWKRPFAVCSRSLPATRQLFLLDELQDRL